jgi:DNA modification methylase
MSHARYLVGDVFDRMAQLEDGSVDLVLTSPPFLALRSYLPADHPDKAKEIGSEPTPAEFLDTLLALTAEWRRVLAPHGSIAVELGDTYSGSGGAGGDYGEGGLPRFRQNADRYRGYSGGGTHATDDGTGSRVANAGGRGWPLAKSLCGIPHLYHLSLAYGRNLLTGEPSPAGQWRVRNVVAWCRPNPPVGALGDKFRPATSYMTIATVARDRYFDLDAVRGNPEDVKDQRHRTTNGPKQNADPGEVLTANYHQRIPSHPAGPPLDWWEIPTQPYSGSHYATWPMARCERPIKAMCPQRVCTTCGEPSRRIVNDERLAPADDRQRRVKADEYRRNGNIHTPEVGWEMDRQTLGWTDCGHDSWRTGIVLDPFAGSGTTLAVATGHGRVGIGIDLDERNAELARERVGMFLDVEYPEAVA